VTARLPGTQDECARLAFLPRVGPPDLDVIQVDGPSPNRGDSRQVRADLELRLAREPGPVVSTCFGLVGRDGRPLLVDAWGAPAHHGGER
jgi:hypothetical protein